MRRYYALSVNEYPTGRAKRCCSGQCLAALEGSGAAREARGGKIRELRKTVLKACCFFSPRVVSAASHFSEEEGG